MTSLIMSSVCTLRLNRRKAFSSGSPSCMRTSAKETHLQPCPTGAVFRLQQISKVIKRLAGKPVAKKAGAKVRIAKNRVAEKQPAMLGTTARIAESACFVSGHGFSHAANGCKETRASAPARGPKIPAEKPQTPTSKNARDPPFSHPQYQRPATPAIRPTSQHSVLRPRVLVMDPASLKAHYLPLPQPLVVNALYSGNSR